MSLFQRILCSKLELLAKKYPFVTITGPRQSGKSTIAKMAFPDFKSVSLEDLDMRDFATLDPRGFIDSFPGNTIIDEVQRVPSLLSYLQTYCDTQNKDGMYVLTGSQSNVLLSAIDQSLAGRTALTTLLPMSALELQNANVLPKNVDTQIYMGGYPRLFAKEIEPTDYFPSYIETYVERDVRRILDIGNLDKFRRMIKLCAGRIGQLLNKSSLAVEVGVSVPTIDAWLSVLQASYIVYLLQPYHENFSKRLCKTPKLYFYDTGLACSLLGINQSEQVATHYLRGGLFENMVINEVVKSYFNRGQKPALWFWRDAQGNEIDLVDTSLSPIRLYEIKSGQTFSLDYFKGLNYWRRKSGEEPEACVVYAGADSFATSSGKVIAWSDFLERQ